MREFCTSGTVRGEGGNILTYSERSWMQQGLTATCKDRGSELRQSETKDPALAHEPV
jgi:hypothetical protein